MIFSFLILGAVIGLLAGLLGIGGGSIAAPILIEIFEANMSDEEIATRTAIGSSLAIVFLTNIMTCASHVQGKHIQLKNFWLLTLSAGMGALLGSFSASLFDNTILKIALALILYYSCIQTYINQKRGANQQTPTNIEVNKFPYAIIGIIIGFLSALVGTGGGLLIIPLLLRLNVYLPIAISYAAIINLVVSATATFSYAYYGREYTSWENYQIGYLNILAIINISVFAMIAGWIGARLVHTLPLKFIKILFVLILFSLATNLMLKSLF